MLLRRLLLLIVVVVFPSLVLATPSPLVAEQLTSAKEQLQSESICSQLQIEQSLQELNGAKVQASSKARVRLLEYLSLCLPERGDLKVELFRGYLGLGDLERAAMVRHEILVLSPPEQLVLILDSMYDGAVRSRLNRQARFTVSSVDYSLQPTLTASARFGWDSNLNGGTDQSSIVLNVAGLQQEFELDERSLSKSGAYLGFGLDATKASSGRLWLAGVGLYDSSASVSAQSEASINAYVGQAGRIAAVASNNLQWTALMGAGQVREDSYHYLYSRLLAQFSLVDLELSGSVFGRENWIDSQRLGIKAIVPFRESVSIEASLSKEFDRVGQAGGDSLRGTVGGRWICAQGCLAEIGFERSIDSEPYSSSLLGGLKREQQVRYAKLLINPAFLPKNWTVGVEWFDVNSNIGLFERSRMRTELRYNKNLDFP